VGQAGRQDLDRNGRAIHAMRAGSRRTALFPRAGRAAEEQLRQPHEHIPISIKYNWLLLNIIVFSQLLKLRKMR
jgi:hypothetical protein